MLRKKSFYKNIKNEFLFLKYFHRYMGAGFSVGEGVMMICQVEAAMCSDGMKLMIFQIRKYLY